VRCGLDKKSTERQRYADATGARMNAEIPHQTNVGRVFEMEAAID
jgi:hypothetical protein